MRHTLPTNDLRSHSIPHPVTSLLCTTNGIHEYIIEADIGAKDTHSTHKLAYVEIHPPLCDHRHTKPRVQIIAMYFGRSSELWLNAVHLNRPTQIE